MCTRVSRITLGYSIFPTLSLCPVSAPSLDQKIFYNRDWLWPPGRLHEA